MCVLKIVNDDKFLFQYGRLFDKFGWTLTKIDLANVLGVSLRKVDDMVMSGDSPKFKKMGKSKKSGVMFFTYDVAEWMCK